MDGLLEQTSVLMHSKIAEAGKKNGLINTRNLMAENRDGLVSVYPAPQYQSHIVGNLAAQSRSDPVQQLLDPNTLQQTVGSHYRPNIILYSENVLRSWGESVSAECCETTFIEDRSPTKDSLEYPDSKFIDLSADDIKIHTLSYDVEEDEDFQELERRKERRPPSPPIAVGSSIGWWLRRWAQETCVLLPRLPPTFNVTLQHSVP
ncbi:synapse differentiation-inducing gene protein 1, partial [Terrapene carolina triunguis]|uniref:synapse differentiation-inducing gene protein 1 n=1 Tax=Terrapene triunguis TaxID=2587831 RepID=UPI0011563548